MKKKLLVLILGIFTSIATLTITLPINTNIVSKNITSFNSQERIILNIPPFEQETSYYCVPAVVQAIFRHYGFDRSQQDIFHELSTDGRLSVDVSQETANWMNTQLSENNVRDVTYYRTNISVDFGENSREQILFQRYVLSALRQNIPIFMVSRGLSEIENHATLIFGIAVNESNPAETIYYYRNPRNPIIDIEEYQFTGNRLPNMFAMEDGCLLGPSNDFYSKNEEIMIKSDLSEYKGTLQDKTVELSHEINLTKELGITNLSELKQFKSVEISDFSLKTSWFDKSYEYKSDSWQTKWFIDCNTGFKKYDYYSWNSKYYNVAYGKFETFYNSLIWTEINDGSFYLSLSYRFFARAMLTSTLIYAKISLGTKIVFKF